MLSTSAATAIASTSSKNELLHLYRRLLRGCQIYPSKNRIKIYESVRDDFKANISLDPNSDKAKQQVSIAYRGLSQLHQFDNRSSSSFAVNLEQNPFPKPNNYVDTTSERVEQIWKDNEEKKNNQTTT